MEYKVLGNPKHPTLVCVPGLLGGPEDFVNLIPPWVDKFHLILLDPNSDKREKGLSGLTEEVMKEYSLESNADGIKEILDLLKIESTYLLGISIGGKIIYDFALKFPDMFLGAVITDVSPGPFEDTELFKLVDKLVTETDMNQTWPDLKKDFAKRITDRNLRSLIQT